MAYFCPADVQSYGRIFLSDSYYVIKYNDETMGEIKY